MLTPKPKVLEGLKKLKKKSGPMTELKCATSHYYKNGSRQGERWIENHWHKRPEMYLLHYQDDNAWVEWQTDRFIWTRVAESEAKYPTPTLTFL